MSPQILMLGRRCAVISLLFIVFLLRSRFTSTWIIWVPEGTHDALVPTSTRLQDLVSQPWTKSISFRTHGRVRMAHYAPRYPMAQWNGACVTTDQHVIEGPCPYPVPMKLVTSGDYTLPYVFGVMKRLQKLYGNEVSEVTVAYGGTVSVKIPGYQIVLGRRHMLERLLRAHQALTDQGWKGTSGQLDMRYPDGFAWKPKVAVVNEHSR